jgi:hypothetical protein
MATTGGPPAAIPAHDLALERAVLGAATYDAGLAAEVARLPATLFVLDRHRQLLRALPRVLAAQPGVPADIVLWRRYADVPDATIWGPILEDGLLVVRLQPYVRELMRLADERQVGGRTRGGRPS